MNDLGFDIDETDLDAQSHGVGVDAARPILLACFTKLVDEALAYHTLDRQAKAYWQTSRQQPEETLHECLGRTLSRAFFAGAPVVPAPTNVSAAATLPQLL